MNPVALASTAGYAAEEILKYLMKNDATNAPKIQKAIDSGYSAEDIIEFLKGSYSASKNAKTKGYKSFASRLALPPGMSERERTQLGASRGNPGIANVLGSVAKSTLPMLALGGTGFALSKAMPTVGQAVGGYLANKVGEAATKPTSAQAPTGAASGLAAGLGALVEPVMRLFGFKDKKLISAVAELAKATGKDVSQIHDDLAKSADISDPDKATQAALVQLKNLKQKPLAELGQEELNETLTNRESAQKKLGTAAPIEQARKKLAKSIKSSVIRKMNYNDDTNELDVIFNNGDTYRYFDFQPDAWSEISAAGTPAKTSGKNKYGVWWVGKDPSLGATFNKVIKPSLKEAGPYAYEKIGNSSITDEEAKELEKLQPLAGKAEKLISSEEKARAVAKKRKLLKPQTKQKAPPGIIEEAEEYLRKLEQGGTMQGKKRRPFVAKELDRLSKTYKPTSARESGFDIKRLVDLLDEGTKKEIGAKLKNKSESEILRFVLRLLKQRIKK